MFRPIFLQYLYDSACNTKKIKKIFKDKFNDYNKFILTVCSILGDFWRKTMFNLSNVLKLLTTICEKCYNQKKFGEKSM